MVARSPQLSAIRDFIVQTAGRKALHNVRWQPGVCQVCAGIPNPGYTRCLKCDGRLGHLGLADTLGFVTYAWSGGQAGQMMRAYKASPEASTSEELVEALLTYAVAGHWDCIRSRTGSSPDGWTHVPSLPAKDGEHPLAALASRFMANVPRVHIRASERHGNPRDFNPDHYVVPEAPPRHVLLLDDTWTGGGHLQSASGALKAAGAEQVTGLVVARWLSPDWSNTQQFMDDLTDPFEPDLCPYTGGAC